MDDAQHVRFTRCWTQAQASVAGYVVAVIGDPHRADDILQDVAVAAMRKFPSYDPSRPFAAWVMGIAKMQILSLRRDRAREAERFRDAVVEDLAAAWEEAQPEAEARGAALARCLGRLDRRARELLDLRYRSAMDPQAIATRLGATSGAVRTALSRLRAALHDCIERRLAEGG